MDKNLKELIRKTIADYKEHYDFPSQGESHMEDCLRSNLENVMDKNIQQPNETLESIKHQIPRAKYLKLHAALSPAAGQPGMHYCNACEQHVTEPCNSSDCSTPDSAAGQQESAEDYLREKYGAYRGHHCWRELEEAYKAGQQAIPEGWKLVPIEPTEKMLNAVLECSYEYEDEAKLRTVIKADWHAMLNAAPTPEGGV